MGVPQPMHRFSPNFKDMGVGYFFFIFFFFFWGGGGGGGGRVPSNN